MKKVFFMLVVSIMCISLSAQDANNELLKKLVEKQVITQQEADDILKDGASKPDKSKTEFIREAFASPYMRFGGYGLFMYNYSDVKEVKHSVEPRVVFLSMRGQLPGKVNYFILAELVNPRVYEFYAEWMPEKEFGIRGGEMKTPNSLENQLSLTELETVFNTRSVSTLIGMGGDVLSLYNSSRNIANHTGRDIGIRANGKIGENDLLEYIVGVYQGAGINMGDNNNTKDFAASLMLQPVKGFRIGGSAYFGQARYAMGANTENDHVRNRILVSSDYRDERAYCRAEWIKANDGGIDKEGLYGMASYLLIPQKLSALAKVDYYNRNKANNEEVIDYTMGVNYYFYKQCRLQLNYTYFDFSNTWVAKNSNAVAGQLQIVF